MEKATEILEKTAVLLEKYKKNKTLVSPADLAGKYKVPFEQLKAQLKEALETYLRVYSLEQLELATDNQGHLEEFAETVNRIFSESGMGKRVGRAALKEFDLEQVKLLAEELRIRIYNEAWVPYFQRHTCLYITDECLADDNPQTPRIYNSLVDKFLNEESGEWTTDEVAKQSVILIYIQEKEKTA